MPVRQKITPFLWYDHQAEDAVKHYLSIFRNSKVLKVMRCSEAGPWPKGTILTITFQIEGQRFVAMNGGPSVKFNQAISLMVNCETQREVNSLWKKLGAGGAESQCGWLTDKFGLSWQITPVVLMEMLSDPDPVKARRVTEAMFTMQRIDIARLKKAYRGK
jgi:predicted 3-demethylubiquinone-9 3-methyltransferase (glyoxalase superfamily)